MAAIPLARLGVIAKDAWILSTTQDPDFTWNAVVLDYIIVVEAPVAIVGLCSPSVFQLWQRAHQSGLSALFRTTLPTDASRTGYSSGYKGDKIQQQRASSRASSEPRQGLVDQGQPSKDDIALDSILQGKNITVEEERVDGRASKLGNRLAGDDAV